MIPATADSEMAAEAVRSGACLDLARGTGRPGRADHLTGRFGIREPRISAALRGPRTRAELVVIQSQRTAALNAPLTTACTCRTVDAAIGLQTCERYPEWSQS